MLHPDRKLLRALLLTLPLTGLLGGCATTPWDWASRAHEWEWVAQAREWWSGLGWPPGRTREAEPQPEAESTAAIDPEIYRRAEAERSEFFKREVERLRADLQQAEESIVALESGLRDGRSRADAVSAVAEARVGLERLRAQVPWCGDRVGEAEQKLDEADAQLANGNVGAAVFFASRAKRITETLRAEARQVALWSTQHTIRGDRVNLRSGPSREHDVIGVLLHATPVFPERSLDDWTLVRTPDGRIGWVLGELLGAPSAPAAQAP